MFKGPTRDIEAVFTAPMSAVCGVTLDVDGKKEYLISGVCVCVVLVSFCVCLVTGEISLIQTKQKC